MTDAQTDASVDFKVGDRIELSNPHFPEKRPTRHVVTKIVPGAGEHADEVMLELDHSMGASPAWCKKARVVYPTQDARDAAALVHALDSLGMIVAFSENVKTTPGRRQTPPISRRLAARCKASIALLTDSLAAIPNKGTRS